MGSTSVKKRQTGDLVAVLRALGRFAPFGLAALVALACAPRPSRVGTPLETSPGQGAILAGHAAAKPDARVLRVGTSGDYAPFSEWPADAAEPKGFSVDVARAFAADRGARIEWVRFRWSELAADLEAGRFDLALSGITVRPDRSTLGRFGLPLTTTAATALVLATSPLATPAELERPGLRIAVNRGGHLERVARSSFGRARIEAVDDNLEVPSRLADGRADAILTDDLEARVWQRTLPPTRAIGPLTRDRKAAWFPRTREDLLREFDRWLLAAEASGELARLRAKNGLAEARTAAPQAALLARLDERLALMPGVARAKHALALPIADPAQEARVHASARESAARAARALGTSPPSAPSLRRFVDAQLAAARFIQTQTPVTPVDPVDPSRTTRRAELARVELDERLRPAAVFLMDRIVWLAVASTAADDAPHPPPEAVADALAAHALSPELVAEIHSALAGLRAEPDVRE